MWGIIFSNNFSGRKRTGKQKIWRGKKSSSKTKNEQQIRYFEREVLRLMC